MHYVPQILLILRFVKGVIRPCWQSVSEADSDAVIANALHGHLDVHACPTSENTWPTTAVYLQILRTALVVSRVSWETGPSTATAKVNWPGRAMSCQLPFAWMTGVWLVR